jgi:cytochrome P450
MFGGETSAEDQLAAYTAIQEYIAQLVAAKRADPTDDVLSDLTDGDLTDGNLTDGDLTDEELIGAGLLLLAAGLDTTSNMLALGTFALLSNPEQLAMLHADPLHADPLHADPLIADKAVEELMRYLSVAKTFMRTALEDVELGGQTIEAGTTVILSLNTANRDPQRFTAPDTLDIQRQATGHLGFGHGVHQCLGQQLARVEMRVAFPAIGQPLPHPAPGCTGRGDRPAPRNRGRLRGEEPPGHLGCVTNEDHCGRRTLRRLRNVRVDGRRGVRPVG